MGGRGDDGYGGGGATAVTVNISCTNGTKFAVEVSLESSVEMFKSVLAKSCDIPAEQQRLIYRGGILKDDQTLKSYGLEADHTVHLVRRLLPVPSNNTVEDETTGGSGGSSLRTLDVSGLPDLEGIHEWLMQNPNAMIEMVEQPHIHNLLNNPEALRNRMMSDPQMRELTGRDPEVARIYNDPERFNQMTEAVRNPDYIREIIRNSDIAAGGSTPTHSAGIDMLSLFSNPQNMNSMAGANTQLRNIPQIREIMRNPGLIHQMSMQEMMALQQSLFSHFGVQVQQSTTDAGETDRGTAFDPENIALDMVMDMLSGPNNSNVYTRQLAQLQEMGFSDTRQNLRALATTAGNLPEAVDRLLGQ